MEREIRRERSAPAFKPSSIGLNHSPMEDDRVRFLPDDHGPASDGGTTRPGRRPLPLDGHCESKGDRNLSSVHRPGIHYEQKMTRFQGKVTSGV